MIYTKLYFYITLCCAALDVMDEHSDKVALQNVEKKFMSSSTLSFV